MSGVGTAIQKPRAETVKVRGQPVDNGIMLIGNCSNETNGLAQRAVHGEAFFNAKRPQTQILTVDDSQEATTLLEDYLSDPSVGITTADSGKPAVEMFRSRSFDLVLLDVNMPEMDGYETCAAMRQIEREQVRSRTPILALTADSDIVSSYTILRSSFDLHLVKPISRITLLQIVGQFRLRGNSRTH
jgi:CheY-like chemotaxis protein